MQIYQLASVQQRKLGQIYGTQHNFKLLKIIVSVLLVPRWYLELYMSRSMNCRVTTTLVECKTNSKQNCKTTVTLNSTAIPPNHASTEFPIFDISYSMLFWLWTDECCLCQFTFKYWTFFCLCCKKKQNPCVFLMHYTSQKAQSKNDMQKMNILEFWSRGGERWWLLSIKKLVSRYGGISSLNHGRQVKKTSSHCIAPIYIKKKKSIKYI